MIVPMKKLSLLLYHRERDSFLKSLQDLGAVHIVEDPEITSDQLNTLIGKLKSADEVVKALAKVIKQNPALTNQAQDKNGNAEEIINTYEGLRKQLEQIEQKIANRQKDIKTLGPWGNFSPKAIEQLETAGVKLRFFELSEKKFNDLPQTDLYLEVINRESGTVFFVVIEREEKLTIEADEVLLPSISLQQAQQEVRDFNEEKAKILKAIEGLVKYQDIINEYINQQTDYKNYESAQLNMAETTEGKILAMTGWIPKEKEKAIGDYLNQYAAWHQFSEPTADDKIPVQLKNNKVSKLFEPILKIYSLPDYFELDPTKFFAPFFAFYFGLCLADLGYGILLIVISILGLTKGPAKLKPFMHLGLLLGGCTLVGGYLLNTFFGAPIFVAQGAEMGFFKTGVGSALLTPVVTEKGTYFPAMPFAMYIGIVQILLGVIMKMINQYRNKGFMYVLQPLSSLFMIIGITILMAGIDFIDMGKLTLGAFQLGPIFHAIPAQTAWYITFFGLALLFLFNNPDKSIPIRLGLGFWELYGFGSGLMGDSLSYLRLFALGLAGGLLGAAFNQIAFMFVLTEEGTINYATPLFICTLLVLIVGHVLNFILAALGSFVHPLRLTFVEFYNNLEFKGGGKAFRPFAKTSKE